MTSIREYDVKLASLKNTRKLTNTMKMVSAGKFQKALAAQRAAQVYASKLSELIARLAASVDSTAHPLLTPHPEPRRALVLLFTSDKGLCAGFNHHLNKFAHRWMLTERIHYDALDVSCIGRRGYMFFRSRMNVIKHYEEVTQRPSFEDAARIGQDLIDAFTTDQYDEIFLAYNVFKSPLSQQPVITQLLPMEPSTVLTDAPSFALDYIFEPEIEQLLRDLLPRILYFKIYYTLLENSAGEHGARMTAMDNATRNADEMVDENTLLRNRARQAAITTELIEIISGADAL